LNYSSAHHVFSRSPPSLALSLVSEFGWITKTVSQGVDHKCRVTTHLPGKVAWAMEELLKDCGKEFESGNPEKACDLLLNSLSSNDPDPILLSDSSLIHIFQHILWQLQSLSSSPSPAHDINPSASHRPLTSSQLSLQFHLLEILAWFLSSDFFYDSNLRHSLYSSSTSKDILNPIIEYLLNILHNQSLHDTSTIGHVYFILSTQALPELFSPYSASFLHNILHNFPKETKNPLRKYAIRALLGLLRSCGSTYLRHDSSLLMTKNFETSPPLELSHLDLLSEWMTRNENIDRNQTTSDELCEFVNLWHGDLSAGLTTSAVKSAKELMLRLR
jgi:hypothetical protein